MCLDLNNDFFSFHKLLLIHAIKINIVYYSIYFNIYTIRIIYFGCDCGNLILISSNHLWKIISK